MNLYNVLLNNKIPFVLLENNDSENVIYCKSFSDYLFNVGTFVTKTKEVILEYVTEGEEKYVFVDVVLENGECLNNVKFKIVIDEHTETPYSTINFDSPVDITRVELPIQQKQIIEESDEVIEEPAPAYTSIPLIETPDYSETINEALKLQRKLNEEKEEIRKQKILLEKQNIVKRKIAEYKQGLLEDYFNATKKQTELLENNIKNSIATAEYELNEKITNTLNDLGFQLEEYRERTKEEQIKVVLKKLNETASSTKAEIADIISNRFITEHDNLVGTLYEKIKLLEETYQKKLIFELEQYKEEQNEILKNSIKEDITAAEEKLNEKITNTFNDLNLQLGEYNKKTKEEQIQIVLEKLEENAIATKTEITDIISNQFITEHDKLIEILFEKTVLLEETYQKKLIFELEQYKEKLFEEYKVFSSEIVEHTLQSKTDSIYQAIDEVIDKRQIEIKNYHDKRLDETRQEIDVFSKEIKAFSDHLKELEATFQESEEKFKSILTEKEETVTKVLEQKIANSKTEFDNIISEYTKRLPTITSSINTLETKVKTLIEEKTKLSKEDFSATQREHIAKTAQYWARRILELGGGGGSVAVQYAKGGTMDGNLSVNNLYPNNNNGEIGSPSNRWDRIYANQIDSLSSNIVVELSGFFVDGDFTVNGTISALGGNSNQWNSTYNTMQANSAGWESVESTVYANSAKWESNYTTTNTYSGLWQSVYTTVSAFSASWEESADITALQNSLTNVAVTSGNWNSNYTTTNSNSALWSNWSTVSASYALGSQYVKLSGDTMTGSLTLSPTDTVLNAPASLLVNSLSSQRTALSIAPVWNNSNTTYTALSVNATDTSSDASSKLMDLQVNGATKLNIDKTGTIFVKRANDGTSVLRAVDSDSGISLEGSTGSAVVIRRLGGAIARFDQNGLMIGDQGGVAGFGIGSSYVADDVRLCRDAANIFGQRKGTNAQTFRLYNTYTDASNYERLVLSASNTGALLGQESAGTGSYKSLTLATSGTSRVTILSSGQVGIGTTAPVEQLTVNGNARANIFIVPNAGRLQNALSTHYIQLENDLTLCVGNGIRTLSIAENITPGNGGIWMRNDRIIGWSTGTLPQNSGDLRLKRIGASSLALDSGDTANTPKFTVFGDISASRDIYSNATGYFNHVAAATKSFYIPHPIKSGMHLQYGSLESPYHGVRLTGTASVKCGDSVVVQLPDYIFSLVHQEGVNIQLTNYQHNKTLFVDDINVNNNTFTVKCEKKLFDKGEYKFFWSFTAIRKDIQKLETEI